VLPRETADAQRAPKPPGPPNGDNRDLELDDAPGEVGELGHRHFLAGLAALHDLGFPNRITLPRRRSSVSMGRVLRMELAPLEPDYLPDQNRPFGVGSSLRLSPSVDVTTWI
jgi:hypothetical protein